MTLQINVLLDVSPRLETLLTTLLGKAVGVAVPLLSPRGPTNVGTEATRPPETEPQRTASAAPESPSVTQEPPSPDTPVITLEILRALASNKGKVKVKPLLDEHGYANISAIPEGDRAAFKTKLEAA